MQSKVFDIIAKEQERQNTNVELIASENFVSDNIIKALGSCPTNKYAEGYPSRISVEKFQEKYPDYVHTGNCGRYYGGCEHIDELELYCRYMWKKAFNTDYHVNVQPHSGSQANMAAYMSVLNVGDKVLSLSLNDGSHLTHGSSVNFSGKLYNMVFYGLDNEGYIDYNDIEDKLYAHHPQLVLAGASAHSRIIDFERISNILDRYEKVYGKRPYFMVDMAHIAGLVVSGDHPSPFGFADIITTTTHKTLRSCRGGLIFCKPELAKKIDSAVFPATQGGGLFNNIAAKAVGAEEACTQEFKEYIHNVVENSKAMANEFVAMGYDVITGGTDNHLFLIDLTKQGVSGKQVQDACDKHNITLNKNCISNETRSPMEASGVRIGTAAMTTKGWGKEEFIACAHEIDKIIKEIQNV